MGASCTDTDFGIGLTPLNVSQVTGLVGVSVTGTWATVTITVPGGGFYWYDMWLSNSATNPTETTNLPSSLQVHWTGYTNSSGIAVITFQNTNASDSWYAWMRAMSLGVSAIITVGV
jgi:hypothetical protein